VIGIVSKVSLKVINLITSTVETQTEENSDTKLNIEYVNEFDISTAKNSESKLYITSKPNLFEELKQYIITYKSEPIVKTKEGKVAYICFHNHNGERIVLTCDNNYGKFNRDESEIYHLLTEECQKNDIQYINQGFGTIVNQLLDRYDGKEKRMYLSKKEKKEIRDKTNGLCALCNLKSSHIEYDHIQPLSNGGSNDITNFQLLCYDCHLKKTTEEQQDVCFDINDRHIITYDLELIDEEYMLWKDDQDLINYVCEKYNFVLEIENNV
jgi:hypothetical protein